MSRYDEDVYENPFFRALKQKFSDLFDTAADNRWLVCIPRLAASTRLSKSRIDFENHIIQTRDNPKESKMDGNISTKFKTANSKEVTIQDDKITTGIGFKEIREVKILFEETFYNSADESFRVLCLDQPLEGGTVIEDYPLPNLETFKDCVNFLWSDAGNKRAQKSVDGMLEVVNDSHKLLNGQSLRHIMDTACAAYARAMQAVLRDSNLKKPAGRSRMYMDNVKIAMESYVMAKLHPNLFNTVCSLYSSQDAAINKATRNLLDLQLRDLGLRAEVYQNLPKGRDQLSKLNKFKTPMGKLGCLKKTVVTISTPVDGHKEVLTADDLLPMLVFLVVKSEIPNWLGNIHYMQNFRLSGSQSGESKYFLSSIEAAVEHIKQGNVSKTQSSLRESLLDSPSRAVPWERLDSADASQGASPVDKFFVCVAEDLKEEVEEMLHASDPSQQDSLISQLCHPLCSCDKCEKLIADKRNDPSTVTVFSRDYKGSTALHVAAEQGLVEMMAILIRRGSIVNASDFNGSTPIHFACQRGHQAALMVLIDSLADINIADNTGNTPLHLSCANGHDDCAKPFFFHRHQRVDVNAPNENGDTALHNAAKWGYESIVSLLLQNGASSLARNKRKRLPSDCSQNLTIIGLLRKAVSDDEYLLIDGGSSKGVSAHILIPRSGSAKKGHSVDVKTSDLAENKLQRESPSPESLPKARGASFDRHQQDVESFVKAAADGDIPMMKFKLGLGNVGNQAESKPARLCHPLCQCEKCIAIKETSSSSRVSIDEADFEGRTALHVSSLQGHRPVVEFLLTQDASANVRNKLGQAPLHLACQYNRQNIAMLLIDCKATVNARDNQGNTPLHFCCNNGHDASAAILLFHGASVNAANGRGDTPLHNAAKWGHATLVSSLFHHGSLPQLKNNMQLIPEQLTQDDQCIDLFNKASHGLIQMGIYARKEAANGQESSGMFDPPVQKERAGTRDSSDLLPLDLSIESSRSLFGQSPSPVKQIISAISDCDRDFSSSLECSATRARSSSKLE